MIKKKILEVVENAIKSAIKTNELGAMTLDNEFKLVVGIPKNNDFGDFAVNVASLSRYTQKSPQDTAQAVANKIIFDDAQINVVGGFINFKLNQNVLNNVILSILNKKENFAKIDLGKNEKIILEYVSANPTGPFHIGHGRWAAMGSALANILKYCGYDVFQEFYINDAGAQIKNLGRSLHVRVLQQLGVDIDFPQDEIEIKKYYPGEYLIPTAEKFINEQPEYAKNLTTELSEEQLTYLADFARLEMLNKQKELLENFNVEFDNFYSELDLHKSGKVEKCIQELKNKDMLYEKDDAVWFKSSAFTDEQDRVIKKTDGSNTYLTADIAYHYDKLQRGFSKLINIWGADHHGYIPRIKASIDALGFNSESLVVLLGQLVNLVIKGEQVRMGKRKKMITLQDLIDEVGVDSTRYWMTMRSIDTALDFDVELAKSKSDDNPVFYVQYAHARACSILRNATSKRINPDTKEELDAIFEPKELNEKFETITLELLQKVWDNADEKSGETIKRLVLKLEEVKAVLENSTKNYAPYLLCNYLQELSSCFHQFYTFTRVLNTDKNLSTARLAIVKATAIILSTVLNLLGVNAPERM